MNVVDMVTKAVFEKIATAAPDMVANLASNIPPDVLEQIKQIGQFVSGMDARLARIEMQQRVIMDALNIGTETDARERTGLLNSVAIEQPAEK